MLAGHGAELSTSREDDVRRRRRGSTTRPGGKRSVTEGGLGCGGGDGMRRRDDARCGPGGWHGRAGVEDDGGATEMSSTYGRVGLGDGGEIEDGGGGGDDRRVDRKVEDETIRYI